MTLGIPGPVVSNYCVVINRGHRYARKRKYDMNCGKFIEEAF